MLLEQSHSFRHARSREFVDRLTSIKWNVQQYNCPYLLKGAPFSSDSATCPRSEKANGDIISLHQTLAIMITTIIKIMTTHDARDKDEIFRSSKESNTEYKNIRTTKEKKKVKREKLLASPHQTWNLEIDGGSCREFKLFFDLSPLALPQRCDALFQLFDPILRPWGSDSISSNGCTFRKMQHKCPTLDELKW